MTVVVLAMAVLVAAVSGAVAAPRLHSSGGTCTDSWNNSAGGTWDTAADWSTGSVPGASDSVCITAPGTYTVVIGNETITVASLTVGASGSTPTLQIGNGGSGFAHISVTGAVTNSGTISHGFGGTFTAGSMTNSGTFTVPSTGFGATMTFGNVTNTGTFAVAGGATLNLTTGTTFDNAGGTISNAASSTLAIATSGTPAATLQLDSGGVVNNSGTINVADTVHVNGGSICGNAVNVGAGDGSTGGTLTFAGSPGTGPACGTGVSTDHIFIYNVAATLSGTIPSAYTVTVGDGGSSLFALALSGNVVNDGTFAPGFGGTVSSAASTNFLTNNGTTVVPASAFPTALNTPIVNNGQLQFLATTSASLANATTWSNTSTGTITVGSHITVAISSPSGQTATLTQAGVINNSGTLNVADAITVNGGSICGDAVNLGASDGASGATLTLSFAKTPVKGPACAKGVNSDRLFIYNVTATIATNIPSGYTVTIGDGGSSFAHVSTPGNLTNAGTLDPAFGATLTVNGTLTNTGTVNVPASGFNTTLNATSVTSSKTFTVNAALTVGLASGGTFTNATKGKLTLVKGILAVDGPVVNNATLTIDAKDALDVNDNGSTPSNFTQAAAGTLVLPAAKVLGLLNVTGAASLAGGVDLSPTGSYLPPFGAATTFVNDASTTGTFATVTGPYTISYGSTKVQAIGHATPPSVVLTPTSGAAGTKVKVTGSGYQIGEIVNIYLDSTSGTALATPKASSTGTISSSITIPVGTSSGPHSVITKGQTSGQTGSATFTVS